jgi:nucleosome binding factor SPN SPT16 subunit
MLAGALCRCSRCTRSLLTRLLSRQTNPERVWRDSSCFAVALSPIKDEEADTLRYNKAIALHLWLFGYEVPGALEERSGTPV